MQDHRRATTTSKKSWAMYASFLRQKQKSPSQWVFSPRAPPGAMGEAQPNPEENEPHTRWKRQVCKRISSWYIYSCPIYCGVRPPAQPVLDTTPKKKKKVPAKVTYFLVCPEGKIQHKWKKPKGWKNSIGKDAFCVRVPASAHRGMLRLATCRFDL